MERCGQNSRGKGQALAGPHLPMSATEWSPREENMPCAIPTSTITKNFNGPFRSPHSGPEVYLSKRKRFQFKINN